jgi:SAM-dependent methyltransferase
MIDYDHSLNLHSLNGPRNALPLLLHERSVGSLLDVGCGTGTWLRAAMDAGIKQVRGIDGIAAKEGFHAPHSLFKQVNFEEPFDLGQKFDLAICLEVAEHLPEVVAECFIQSVCRHADDILFSAACPGQPGQHHVNCQWPEYWQTLFNKFGFVCQDSVRWRIWSNSEIEVWYRQNIFEAKRDPDFAGREPRLPGVIHPESLEGMTFRIVDQAKRVSSDLIAHGRMPTSWYLRTCFRSALCKMMRRL